MQQALLNFLRCPVSGKTLELKIIDLHVKQYENQSIEEINNAILFSDSGFFFPVINGIPRMQLEGVLLFSDFFQKNLSDYEERKKKLLEKYGRIINDCFKRNEATRKSFSFEWSLLKGGEPKIWHSNLTQFRNELFIELDETGTLVGRLAVDIGCGHGYSSHFMAEAGATVIGIDMSFSIEAAYGQLRNENVHFIQADLQFPPLMHRQFDIVYSSGVIHHTNNTELSFGIIQELVKPDGKLCIWLYHPIKSTIHNTMLFARHLTEHVSVRIQFWIYFFTLLPTYLLVVRIKGKKMSWREIMIDLIDILTPYYRYEHEPQETECWYTKHGYGNVKVTSSNFFGFSVYGIKL